LKGAEDAYRRALAIAPQDGKLQLALARVLTARLDTAAAAPLYRDYLARHPDDVEALRGLAQCASTQGDVPEALRLLETALQASPEDFATLREYGEMLLASGDAQAAVAPLEKAHRMIPEHAKLANSLARALKTSGRRDEAQPLLDFVAEARPQLEHLAELERRLRLRPDDVEARIQFAEITAKYVSRRDAIRWYENLLRMAPHSTAAAEALSKLKREMSADATRPPRQMETNVH
jgi:tetratricopeptide (TPR) repeat protein